MIWNSLESIGQLDKIEITSKEKAVLIFKHSTRCGISFSALEKVQEQWKPVYESKFDCYLLDLLSYREISNLIAKKYNIIHQSPQLLLICNAKCISSQNHYSIDLDKIILNQCF